MDSSEPGGRALERLAQLAREEREAVDRSDVEALCRIAQLLPAATRAVLDTGCDLEAAGARLDEIQATHSDAVAFLAQQMEFTAQALKTCAQARRAGGAYAGAPRSQAVVSLHQMQG